MAAYHPGDAVQVLAFGKGIVRERRNNDRYLVEIKGRAMEVMAVQLVRLTTPPSSSRARPSAPAADPPHHRAGSAPVITLDLHGHTVDEALAALDAALNHALLAGAAELLVIHGRSGGRIRSAVHRRLQEVSAVRHYRLDPRNSGVTRVQL